ncbi:hypothetical protein LMG33818_002287 [Halomonadaceae bacterium LMG 33818]|uniref:MFS transporter n=1 Tax=Cernens ardua TaxID=3402176 RepID=UPI003EDC8DBD
MTLLPDAQPRSKSSVNMDSSNFHWLWFARASSMATSAISMGAFSLIAVRELHATPFMLSLITAISGIFGALLAFLLSAYIDRRDKRPTMLCADIVRSLLYLSIPLAAMFGILTFTQLLMVSAVSTFFGIVFGGVSTAYIKDLIPPDGRTRAIARLSSTAWLFNTIGPALGGSIIQWVGATATLTVTSVGLIISALGVTRISHVEAPPLPAQKRHFLKESLAGFNKIHHTPMLRPLFVNSVLFGGIIAWISPLESMLLLKDLQLPAWQYGLTLGLPCAGGIVGAWLAPKLGKRFGERYMMNICSVLRGLPVIAIPFIPTGPWSFLEIAAANFFLLLAAGGFGVLYIPIRMQAMNDAYITRIVTAFTLSSRLIAPMLALAGGIIGTYLGIRMGIFVGALLLIFASVILPYRNSHGIGKAHHI